MISQQPLPVNIPTTNFMTKRRPATSGRGKGTGSSQVRPVPAGAATGNAPPAKGRKTTTSGTAKAKVPKISNAEKQASLRFQIVRLMLGNMIGRTVTFEELGVWMGKANPARGVAYDKSTISRTAVGERGLSIDDVLAICAVCRSHHIEIDPGWLAFGDQSAAPEPLTGLTSSARPAR